VKRKRAKIVQIWFSRFLRHGQSNAVALRFWPNYLKYDELFVITTRVADQETKTDA